MHSKEERNILLREWINAHDLINIAALCRRIDYNRGTFSRFLEGHQELGEKATTKLENILTEYGYEK